MPLAQRLIEIASAGRPALYKLRNSSEAALLRSQICSPTLQQVGEDALLIDSLSANQPSDSCVFFGVADGVGGWRDQGVDPGESSLALLGACCQAAKSQLRPTLKRLLASAVESLFESKPELTGSTTLCFARVNPVSYKLEVANLGDSGLCLIDSSLQLKGKTKFQANMGGVFNCPYQLAFPRKLSSKYPGPEACDTYSLDLSPGDIVVMATDGLWDNLYLPAVQQIVQHAMQEKDSEDHPLERAASLLVDAATYMSSDPEYHSPFSANAKDAGHKFVGGKEDDISVVVMRLPVDKQQASSCDNAPKL